MLIKKEKEAENIFLDVYNMKGYKKIICHSFFISVYTYFLYTMYNENKNAKYKILLYNIINIYHIELTFMFIPCWFEIITSNNIREKISISIEEILKKNIELYGTSISCSTSNKYANICSFSIL